MVCVPQEAPSFTRGSVTTVFVLDTDILSLYQRGHPGLTSKIDSLSAQELAISVITVEEELAGWYNLLRKVRDPDDLATAYQHLAGAIPVLARWPILSMTRTAINRYETLKSLKLNIRKMDPRIAAIVLDHGGILVTRNLRDFQRVLGLVVQDWSR
jgi:tRNA(fMet)-specific endonuclease VapC